MKIIKVKRGSNVGMCSLVWVMGTPPFPHGNYFNITHEGECINILNLWLENYNNYPKGEVTLHVYDKNAIAVDEDIPDKWFNNKLCLTGSKGVTRDIAYSMYKELGDDMSELEYWDDPKTYYARKGRDLQDEDVTSKFPEMLCVLIPVIGSDDYTNLVDSTKDKVYNHEDYTNV